jgi:hypothetical protein
MNWLHDISCFFAGVFLTNAIPHFVSGVMGRPFQSPFAKPPGKGLSTSTVNVVWGFFNLAVGCAILSRGGNFDPRSLNDMAFFGLGVLFMGLMCARLFGRFHGGHSADGA